MIQFHKLSISELHTTTAEASVLTFKIPDELREVFKFKAGQYLTLKFDIDGQEQRRSYSICTSTQQDDLSIGVKRVKDGVVSNHIANKLKVGDTIEVMPPQGLFTVEPDPAAAKKYFLIAAGSGITPILSIARTLLELEKNSQVHLLYGNQNKDSIMFLAELESLQNAYPASFHISHCLSRQKRSLGGFFKKKESFEYRKGRVDAEAIGWFLENYGSNDESEFYLCGPGLMLQNTLQTLKTLAVPEDQIYTEYFTSEDLATEARTEKAESGSDAVDSIGADEAGGIAAQLTAHLEGEVVEIDIEAGQTVLQSLIDAGYNPPYSCEGGVCSTCMCKLKQGKVHMKNNLALSDDEVAKGYILSCQSLPLTAALEVEYED